MGNPFQTWILIQDGGYFGACDTFLFFELPKFPSWDKLGKLHQHPYILAPLVDFQTVGHSQT